jgi:hypothetical protein
MKRSKSLAVVLILLLLFATLPGAGALAAAPQPQDETPDGPQAVPDDVYWSDRFIASGVTDHYGDTATVRVIRKDAAGNLYVGGDFMWAGGIRANGIAKWDVATKTWSALGDGMEEDAVVYDILIDGATVYAAGSFVTASGVTVNNVARWNGGAWSALGSGANVGTNAVAYALAKGSGNDIYVGGWFDKAGGSSVAASRIAMWNGSTWSALGAGVSGAGSGGALYVNSLAWDGAYLYACGVFAAAGGTTGRTNIARWNGTAWSGMGAGLGPAGNSYCDEVVAGGGKVYAGGYFTTAGAVSANNIAMWNGSTWSALGAGANNSVNALALLGSNLYAGGDFTTIGGVTVTGTAVWNGSSWSAVAPTPTAGDLYEVDSILPADAPHLYVGGYFWRIGAVAAQGIALWDGLAWSGLGPDNTLRLADDPYYEPSTVNAVAVDASGRAYAGGEFLFAGDQAANYVAMWDADHWEALGSGVSYEVTSLATRGDTLYVGGYFNEAGGQPASYVARWDGASWSALGGGPPGGVRALAVDGEGNVYASGSYWTGSASEGFVSMWDGAAWASLGTAPGGVITALALDGAGNLYAGGNFTAIGGVSAANVALWNGAAWSALGSGIGPQTWHRVNALAVRGSNLYASGTFASAGGNPASNIARWDGSSWWALGGGLPGEVYALAGDSLGALYVGGSFTAYSGGPGDRIARWVQGAGSSGVWSPLGSGCNDYVYGLATLGTDVFAGGAFEEAGGKPSIRFGLWSPPEVTLSSIYLPLVVR